MYVEITPPTMPITSGKTTNSQIVVTLVYHPPFLARVSILTEHHCSDVTHAA